MQPRVLQALLQADATSLFLLSCQGEPVGLCEALDQPDGSIRTTHFGVVPALQGKGFGRFLFDASLRALWRGKPCMVWLHTDTNDHPAALHTYLRAGFTVAGREWQDFSD